MVPVEGQGGITLSYVRPQCHRFSIEDRIWWVTSGRGKKAVQLVVRSMWKTVQLENANRILVVQDTTDRREAKVFRAHAAPHGVCDNLINGGSAAREGSDSPVNVPVAGLQERSRLKMTEELGRFIATDNQEAINIEDLEKTRE